MLNNPTLKIVKTCVGAWVRQVRNKFIYGMAGYKLTPTTVIQTSKPNVVEVATFQIIGEIGKALGANTKVSKHSHYNLLMKHFIHSKFQKVR